MGVSKLGGVSRGGGGTRRAHPFKWAPLPPVKRPHCCWLLLVKGGGLRKRGAELAPPPKNMSPPLQNPDIVLVHYLNVPSMEECGRGGGGPPLCAVASERREWSKWSQEELLAQLRPMCEMGGRGGGTPNWGGQRGPPGFGSGGLGPPQKEGRGGWDPQKRRGLLGWGDSLGGGVMGTLGGGDGTPK